MNLQTQSQTNPYTYARARAHTHTRARQVLSSIRIDTHLYFEWCLEIHGTQIVQGGRGLLVLTLTCNTRPRQWKQPQVSSLHQIAALLEIEDNSSKRGVKQLIDIKSPSASRCIANITAHLICFDLIWSRDGGDASPKAGGMSISVATGQYDDLEDMG